MNRITRWLVLRQLKAFLEKLDKGGQMEFLKAFFGGSKKATAVLIGILGVVLGQGLGLDQEMVDKIVMLLMTYLGAQGLVDTAMAWKGDKTK